MAAANQPYQVYAGQNFEGSHVEGARTLFAAQAVMTHGLAAGGNTPTIVLPAGQAGNGATVATQNGYDMAGNFTVTGGTSMAAGTVATVTFGQPLNTAPSAVMVTCGNAKAGGAAGISCGAVAISATGFNVFANTAGSLSGSYVFSYLVVQSPYG